MTSASTPRRNILLAAAGAGAGALAGTARAAEGSGNKGPVHVVYHVTQGASQAKRCLNNVRNHLNVDPTVKIVVVGNGAGIDFMLNDAKDPEGEPFAGLIGGLASRGVSFRVCENTLHNRNISKDRVLLDANLVTSGVVEAANLQFRDGYAYISP